MRCQNVTTIRVPEFSVPRGTNHASYPTQFLGKQQILSRNYSTSRKKGSAPRPWIYTPETTLATFSLGNIHAMFSVFRDTTHAFFLLGEPF